METKCYFIVEGDTTSHGAIVTGSRNPMCTIDDKKEMAVGDAFYCPQCRRMTAIVTGEPMVTLVNGARAAREGDTTDCGSVLQSVMQKISYILRDMEAEKETPVQMFTTPDQADNASGIHDEQCRIIDRLTKLPIADHPYKIIKEDGEVISGNTGADGLTNRITTPSAELLQLHVKAHSHE